jgi:uncharacterized membrane protein YphA (DoxX/SURF4 family)
MIPTTLLFHTNFTDQNQMIHFFKNLSMSGGLLYVMIYGAGTPAYLTKSSCSRMTFLIGPSFLPDR